ncbi:MAG TPA: DUF5107 domain-containing protein [Herpetosiphonaceae bacterium]
MHIRIVLLLLLVLLAATQALPMSAQSTSSSGFAASEFRNLWVRTDQPVASGSAGRSWVWGAAPADRRYERYADAPGGTRLVQYFDKARMEITNPGANRSSPWFVTNGLLVVEMISGRMQVGANVFAQAGPADAPIAGDPVGSPSAPSYRQLAPFTTIEGSNRAPSRIGQRISAVFNAGSIGDDPARALPETTIVRYEAATGHNVPRVFHEFMNASGPVIEGGRTVRRQVIDPLFAFGYPITEPYWARVSVGGQARDVLFQAFERRVLTYTPANPAAFRVEMGNVGLHYYRWRYGQSLTYAQPPFTLGVATRETSITIPTYDLSAALVPTAPGDPIYPYPRLDRSKIGPLQPRSYRAVIVENRFMELTFLPELGGRLYQAIDKATRQNIFYRNPVVKPSPFGQRGWWLGVGGLEWAAPTEEHGYLENVPWDLALSRRDGAVTARLTTTERQTGLGVAGSITLRPDEGRFAARMSVSNPTGEAKPLQMWTNATLSPGGTNTIGPGLRFSAPTDSMIVHATQDRDLPGPRGVIGWPLHNGRDLSRPANWSGYLGGFTPSPVGYLGAYDTALDSGAVVLHGTGTVGGKFFGFSRSFDKQLYTDGDSEYVELWSGAQPTFWDYPPLAPGTSRTFDTAWQPLFGIGDLSQATGDGAVGVVARPDGGRTVTVQASRIVANATVVIRRDGQEIFRSAALDLRPDQPLAIELPASAATGRLQIEAPGIDIVVP